VKITEHNICTTCSPSHVDNCPKCFGWGLTSSGAPISASRAVSPPEGWKKCPVCGGEQVKERR
jgi:hypothetical protein